MKKDAPAGYGISMEFDPPTNTVNPGERTEEPINNDNSSELEEGMRSDDESEEDEPNSQNDFPQNIFEAPNQEKVPTEALPVFESDSDLSPFDNSNDEELADQLQEVDQLRERVVQYNV